MSSSLSIIVPIHDEASSLRELHERLRVAVGQEAELIFVDDGSTDDSSKVLDEMRGSDPSLRVLTLRRKYLSELRKKHPDVVETILFNLGRILSERLADAEH